MSGASRSQAVLEKLLKLETSPEQKVETFLSTSREKTKKVMIPKRKGRPRVEGHKKARNFSLCLARSYVDFLDKMTVRDPKVQGRGRKIRFIIDRFLVHEKRQLRQLRVLRNALKQTQQALHALSGRVTKGEKLSLTTREKQTIDRAVARVETLTEILGYTTKELQSYLPPEEWSIMAFSLDWKTKRGVIL